jgi:hypothetical protein
MLIQENGKYIEARNNLLQNTINKETVILFFPTPFERIQQDTELFQVQQSVNTMERNIVDALLYIKNADLYRDIQMEMFTISIGKVH